MMHSILRSRPSVFALLGLTGAFLAACSGSSDGGDPPVSVAGLSAPGGVSVVEANLSDVSTGGSPPNAGSNFPANSAYVNDAASVRVIDPSIDAVQTANGILCQIGMTRFSSFVNEATYKAQVDTAICGDEPDISESGTVTPRIHLFTLDVDRASNDAPQSAKFWLGLEESGSPVTIHGEMVVTEAPSDTDPYGAFTLTYAGVPDGGSVDNPIIFGVLASDSGEIGFRFLEGFGDINVVQSSPGDQASLSQLVVTRDPATGEGAGKVTQSFRENDGSGDSGIMTSTWRVAFDDNNVLRQLNAEPAVALARGDYVNHVYRYGVYHNDGENLGEPVQLNAGLSVEMPSGSYGWVGYHGAWAPDGEDFANGDTVTAETNAGDVAYEVVAAPGKLKRVTRDTLLLTELGTQRFEWWDGPDQFQVAYSGVEWQRMAQRNISGDGWIQLPMPTVIDVSAAGGFLQMWSPFIGGVTYQDGDAEITYVRSELVTGNDPIFTGVANLEIFATHNGLKSEIDLANANAGTVFLDAPVNVSNAHRYVFDPADMTLRLDVGGGVLEDVGLSSGVEPDSGPNTWGMQSGPMVLGTALANMTDIYDVFDEDEYFVYETGHNPWNQFIGLKDSTGAFVEFDAPIEMLYSHSSATDMNGSSAFDGQQILLSYNGPGRLFGIPGSPVDLGGDGEQYLPDFSLADGTVIGAAGEYIVRALGVDQTLQVDGGGAPQLDITDADPLVVPPASLYVTPDIGAQPTVAGPPRVIDGVIQ